MSLSHTFILTEYGILSYFNSWLNPFPEQGSERYTIGAPNSGTYKSEDSFLDLHFHSSLKVSVLWIITTILPSYIIIEPMWVSGTCIRFWFNMSIYFS
jgi:hypothetical protein